MNFKLTFQNVLSETDEISFVCFPLHVHMKLYFLNKEVALDIQGAIRPSGLSG